MTFILSRPHSSTFMYKENVLDIIPLLEPRPTSMSQRGRPLPKFWWHLESFIVKQVICVMPAVFYYCSVYMHSYLRDCLLERFNSLSKLFIVCLISEDNIVDYYEETVDMVRVTFLFSLYINPTTAEQLRYNRAHICTKGMVECMLGVWKKLILVFTLYTEDAAWSSLLQ